MAAWHSHIRKEVRRERERERARSPSPRAKQRGRVREREEAGRERERERVSHEQHAVLSVQAVEVSPWFLSRRVNADRFKKKLQAIRDICERIPGLGRFQLSPPPVAVSVAWVV